MSEIVSFGVWSAGIVVDCVVLQQQEGRTCGINLVKTRENILVKITSQEEH